METIEFESSGSSIKGYFFPAPGSDVISTLLFLQGFPGMEGDELICERLAQANIHVLTFNYRGTFRSEGYFSFSNAVDDIGAAFQFLRDSQFQETHAIDPEKIILGGWSFGSGIVFAGAVCFAAIRKIFAISGRDFGEEARKIENDPEYAETVTRNLAGIRAPEGPVNYRDDLLSDLIQNQAILDTGKLVPYLKDRDILLIGGWDDEVNAIEDHILPLYRALKGQGTKVRIEAFQDEHEFSENKDKLVQVIVNWLTAA